MASLFLVLAAGCGGGGHSASSSTTTASTTTTTSLVLTDAESVYCQEHQQAPLEAARSLGVTPTATLTVEQYQRADGTRDLDGMTAAFDTANADPGNAPHYNAPGGDHSLYVFLHAPWYWYSAADLLRACKAAFASR